MKKHLRKFGLWVCVLAFGGTLFAQDYSTLGEQENRLKSIANASGNATLKSLVKTEGGKDIWMLTLGTGDVENKPAMAIVGGVEGSHLLGVEMALRFAEDVINNRSSVLDETTFYVFPNMSPDAYDAYFNNVKWERNGNSKDTDDDRDGRLNEDGYEDLDGNGIITLMRVADATGNWMMHPADNRIMIPADKEKGEQGGYKVFSEGRDNDRDGSFNEDGAGGIRFNKNLTFEYDYFTPGAGEHPVSELETRALLDELYLKWNIYGIFTFGPGNNLSSPWKYNRAGASQRVVTSVLAEDAKLNELISKEYNETVGLKDAPASVDPGGDFHRWAYFHFGRLSLGTPGWWVPMIKGDSSMKANSDKNREVNFLRWAAQEGLENYFVDWKEMEHPDFPGQEVEVGGIAPYVMMNPPIEMIGPVVDKHNQFITELTAKQAKLEFVNMRTEGVGKDLTRITVDVYNSGVLPTHTQMGARSRWLRPVKVTLNTENGQEIVSGRKMQMIRALNGDNHQSFSWLVKGKGSVLLEVGAPHVGFISSSINLK